MADNEIGMLNATVSKQRQQQEPSTSQSQSSTLARTTLHNDECNELTPVDVDIRQRRNRSERISSTRSRKVVGTKEDEQTLSGKFDFNDRDERPVYNIALPLFKEEEGKEWTIEELKTLHSCINSHGINDNFLVHATKSIPNRSMLDIREKISGIRELARRRHEIRNEARRTEWLKGDILPSKTSEIQDWSSAIHVIQNRKRRINDYTDSALLDYLVREVKCRPASVDTRKYFRVTDSAYARSANRKQIVDCADYYRFLQTCLSETSKMCMQTAVNIADSAIILNILEEIQKEVDDPKHEKRRRLLAGMFRDIQSGDLSDYDFRDTVGSDDMLCLQLNPLGLMREMLEIGNE